MKNIVLCALLGLSLLVVGCKDEDDPATVSLRDSAEVYAEDIAEIETYLKSCYVKSVTDDEVVVDSIGSGSFTAIWDMPELHSVILKNDSRDDATTTGLVEDAVSYKVYYLLLNEGGGVRPNTIDSTFVAYKGWNLENEIFDRNVDGHWFSFPESGYSSISGFRQIISAALKTAGSSVDNGNGTITYSNYGRLVVFIPSGLAYFASALNSTDAYSPIAFEIKLYSRKERDHDRDRILSVYEDTNGNGDFFDDDTDGDGTPDFYDIDDDNDGVQTKREIRKAGSPYSYYTFGEIPSCNGTTKRHLDKTCKGLE